MTSAESIRRVIEALGTRPVNVLVNNAGLQYVASLEDFPGEQWDLLVRVMLNGAYLMTRAVLPGMKRRGFGRIVNMGSIHSLVASPFKSAYVAAKHGLLGFAKAVALETAQANITINTICPSYVRTALVDKQIASLAKEHGLSADDVIREIMLKPMPKGVFITIEELYGIVAFLASDCAATSPARPSRLTAAGPSARTQAAQQASLASRPMRIELGKSGLTASDEQKLEEGSKNVAAVRE